MRVSPAAPAVSPASRPRPPYRAIRPRCPRALLRLPQRVLIRIGPDLIELRRERRIGRILNDRNERDRFTPCPRPDLKPRITYDAAGRPDPASEHAAFLDQSLARTQRDLAIAEGRLRAAELKLIAFGAPAARVRVDEPVAYAYRWVPPASAGSPAPIVVHVPGVVRGYIDPTGRVINVLM